MQGLLLFTRRFQFLMDFCQTIKTIGYFRRAIKSRVIVQYQLAENLIDTVELF
ncbi:Uncharacterised protein [Klebsiella pneumoniae subsp. ozaenae]|uniref:Uncharacterized protein n=1 Tax=Klebsiella pneumoniae subsp. ozaenae TaxID=574 RepID=A0A377Z390_KLEPO|nr:Uncharacterised protein [Klebsiella pneumoniae subsp. ozaenae]